MGRCANCGKFIIGGKKQGNLRYCNDACHQIGFLARVAEDTAPELIEARLLAIREQHCPLCGNIGPVDLYTSHSAWSLMVITSWKDRTQLSCVYCGRRRIRRAMAFTAVCGWWGFPFGLVVTPWQLLNGAKALSKSKDSSAPAEHLKTMVKLEVTSSLQQGLSQKG